MACWPSPIRWIAGWLFASMDRKPLLGNIFDLENGIISKYVSQCPLFRFWAKPSHELVPNKIAVRKIIYMIP